MRSYKKLNPSPGRLGPPFIEKRGCHSGTQEVERVQCCEVILRITCQGAFNVSCLGVLALSGTGEKPVSSVAAPSCVDTRPGQRCLRCHVGRQAAEVAQWWVFTKICMLPRRCLPSWLGRQLHACGDGGLVGVGLMVALRVSSARALPGPRQGSCRGACCHPRQGACRGPLVFLGWDPAKGCRLLSAYLILNVFTKICMLPR